MQRRSCFAVNDFILYCLINQFVGIAAFSQSPLSKDNNREIVENEFSNFWGSTVSSDSDKGFMNLGSPPSVNSLDADGPLPLGSYLVHGNPLMELKPTCRVAVNIGIDSRSIDIDAVQVVKFLQTYFDNGLTTLSIPSSEFQPWVETEIYGRLVASTPSSVLDGCNLMLPYRIPQQIDGSTPIGIRRSILGSLEKTGASSIDTLQLVSTSNSPYHMDVLDVVSDLQREGLVRSTMAQGWSCGSLRQAENCSFLLDIYGRERNILSSCTPYQQLASSDSSSPLFISGPLAGGLLTNKFLGKRFHPRMKQMINSRHWQSLEQWSRTLHGASPYWENYQQTLLRSLDTIAMEHRVSIAEVALRWSLQMNHVASAAVTHSFTREQESQLIRIRDLRRVFSFHLGDEEMQQLSALAGNPFDDVVDPATNDLGQSDIFGTSSKHLWL